MEKTFEFVFATIGTTVSMFFGGLSLALQFLLLLMVIDYVTGMSIAAKGFSSKSSTGKISSKAGFDGLMRKFMIITWVVIATVADVTFGWDIFTNMVVFAFIANELISITENSIALGVPVPDGIAKLIDTLKVRSEEQKHDISQGH